jgi:hypothetical protein
MWPSFLAILDSAANGVDDICAELQDHDTHIRLPSSQLYTNHSAPNGFDDICAELQDHDTHIRSPSHISTLQQMVSTISALNYKITTRAHTQGLASMAGMTKKTAGRIQQIVDTGTFDKLYVVQL